nr:RHS repeat-associated core domain-containing protein [Parerythrobacter lacustris]
MLKRYLHGPAAGADDPLVEYAGAGTAASNRRNLYTDARGSIVLSTDSAGGAAQINSYDEYGVPGQANTGRFQYTGQIWLPELGMNYYKARMYSPLLGRFMQTDPIGYEDDSNLYGYVGNDPVNGVDPTGLAQDDKRTLDRGFSLFAKTWKADGSQFDDHRGENGGARRAGEDDSDSSGGAPQEGNQGIAGPIVPAKPESLIPFLGGIPGALSEQNFDKIARVHNFLRSSECGIKKSCFYSNHLENRNSFFSSIVVPVLANPFVQISFVGRHIELRSNIPGGMSLGVTQHGSEANTIVVRGIVGSFRESPILVISNVLLE